MSDTIELLSPVLIDLADVVEHSGNGKAPTPCTEWDVATLRTHATEWLNRFADGYADPAGKVPADGPDQPSSPQGQAELIRSGAAKLTKAVQDGAAERPLVIGSDGMPGDMALSMILWEYLQHGWDLAKATGQEWKPNPAAARAALDFAPNMLTPDYQGEGKTFGPRVAVPDSASYADQLAGLSGRNPNWTPPAG